MRPIPQQLKNEMENDLYYKKCSRKGDGYCDGRITWEHCLIYAGRQINEKWAIIPLCEFHHAVNTYQDGKGLDKQKNVWIALNRATDNQLKEYSKVIDYIKMRNRLNKIYGEYNNKR
jgi:hypothetical protein